MSVPGAAKTIEALADPGSFQPWPGGIASNDPLGFADRRAYPDRLAAARSATGSEESVRAGAALITGVPVALLVSEYRFVGGSIGAATGELITRTFERAAAERLPVVAVTRSGGTRMQEGNYGFVQIAKSLAAADRFRRAGLAYVVYLAHPTTGGVLASWGSRAQVRFAEPGALIGFAGPRGTEATTGARLPAGVQSAENLAAHGLIDEVVPFPALRERLGPLLRVLGRFPRASPGTDVPRASPVTEQRQAAPPAGAAGCPAAASDPWDSVLRTREPGRPGARELLAAVADEPTYLHGDGQGGADDPAILTLVCRLGGTPALVIAHDRQAGATGARPGADAYRKARRGIALARELHLPLLTVVDTPGAELSRASEEGGLAHQLAGCLTELLSTPSPVLCVLLGEGGGGGALALLCGDMMLAAEHAWLAPIAPEAASAILYGSAERAGAMARGQRVGAWPLRELGLADRVIADPAGPSGIAPLAAAVREGLHALLTVPQAERLGRRHDRYRHIGNGSLRETSM